MCFGFYSKALITCHLNTVPHDLYCMLVLSMHIYYMTSAKMPIMIVTVLTYYQFAVIS